MIISHEMVRSELTRERVVAVARTWLGTRFQHQQRMKGVACDCYGMLLGTAIECGIEHAQEVAATPKYQGYAKYPDPKTMLDGLRKYMVRIPATSVLPADVLWMKFDNEPRHFALVSEVGPPIMIVHAYAQARKVTESAVNVWGGIVMSAWRFKEFA